MRDRVSLVLPTVDYADHVARYERLCTTAEAHGFPLRSHPAVDVVITTTVHIEQGRGRILSDPIIVYRDRDPGDEA